MPKTPSQLDAEIKQVLTQKSSDQGFGMFDNW
jgi:hypothetical protein